jgi:hypothetical protein
MPYLVVGRSIRFGLAAWLALSMACGGGGGGTTAVTPPAADFAIQVSPASVQIPAGGSAFITVTLSRLNGFTAPVILSGTGLPSGVVVSGTIPSGSGSIQIPVSVAPGVAASTYAGLTVHGQAGTLVHDSAFGLTVAQPLVASHLRDDLVQAPGGRQVGGAIENHSIVREALPAKLIQDTNDTLRVRQGFTPTGMPTDH